MQPLRRDLERIYDNHRDQLFTCALAITGHRELAEDALHDAFRRLLSLDRRPRKWKAYVFRSVRNSAVDCVRRHKRPIPLDENYVFDPLPDPQETVQQRQWRQDVASELLNLTPDQRETIVQHLYGDLTFRKIAELREVPLGTVTSWYRRGLEKLRIRLEEQHG